jgi:hypothetical protein
MQHAVCARCNAHAIEHPSTLAAEGWETVAGSDYCPACVVSAKELHNAAQRSAVIAHVM